MSLFHPLWLAALIGASAFLTAAYTCVAPFAAFAVVAATAVSRRQAVVLTVALWLVNQAVGFGVLNYPWTATSMAWGVAIGASAVIGTLAAHWAIQRLVAFSAPTRTLAAFATAFVVYEVVLYVVAVSALGGTEAFAPQIVGQVLLVNAATFVSLYALSRLLAVATTLLSRRRRHASLARSA
jgi:hypothetical protein